MANFLYSKAREAFLGSDLDWDAHTFKWQPVTSGYVPDQSTHDFLSDIAGGNRVGGLSPAVGSKTKTNGVASCGPVTLEDLAAAGTIVALVLVRDTGVEATSNLVVYIDSVTAGLPFTPDGSDFVITPPAGGLFTL